MAYSFKHKDKDLIDGVKRIAASQIDAALEELGDENLSRAELVHQLRKRCKKVRGLIRLVRPGFPAYDEENAVFRDAARRLSFVRDATALIETFDRVSAYFATELAQDAFGEIKSALILQRADIDADKVRSAFESFRQDMMRARSRVEDWTLEKDPEEVMEAGVEKTFKRAVKAMKQADKTRSGEDLHEWRKRVKYHWYHGRLLKRVWPPIMKAHVKEADALSDDLGDHHDLIVFAQILDEENLVESERVAEGFRGLMTARRKKLEQQAFNRCAKLLAETPDNLAGRWTDYWRAWRER